MPRSINNEREYNDLFKPVTIPDDTGTSDNKKSIKEKALVYALDTGKFKIRLYCQGQLNIHP